MKANSQIEFGDFQTPLTLAKEVCRLLRRAGEAPDFVLEPTCGRGAFLVAAAEAFAQAIRSSNAPTWLATSSPPNAWSW